MASAVFYCVNSAAAASLRLFCLPSSSRCVVNIMLPASLPLAGLLAQLAHTRLFLLWTFVFALSVVFLGAIITSCSVYMRLKFCDIGSSRLHGLPVLVQLASC